MLEHSFHYHNNMEQNDMEHESMKYKVSLVLFILCVILSAQIGYNTGYSYGIQNNGIMVVFVDTYSRDSPRYHIVLLPHEATLGDLNKHMKNVSWIKQ